MILHHRRHTHRSLLRWHLLLWHRTLHLRLLSHRRHTHSHRSLRKWHLLLWHRMIIHRRLSLRNCFHTRFNSMNRIRTKYHITLKIAINTRSIIIGTINHTRTTLFYSRRLIWALWKPLSCFDSIEEIITVVIHVTHNLTPSLYLGIKLLLKL